jgi:hypothetical protein
VDPRQLPYRTHKSFYKVLKDMDAATLIKDRNSIAMYHGIRRAPVLCRVGSINYARSCPYDWMHLLLENVVQNLVKLWTGKFPGIPAGQDFEIAAAIWEQIGLETAEATKDIPSPFVRFMGNIADNRATFTAESWSFWFMFLAPILLKDRFEDNKYYDHMVRLVDIMKITLQFDITFEQLDVLNEKIINWVEDYEK